MAMDLLDYLCQTLPYISRTDCPQLHILFHLQPQQSNPCTKFYK